MSQPEASIVVHVQTKSYFKAMLISSNSQKRREAVERRMVIEDDLE
jgi:uncharacterized protein (DUF2384 family)